MKTIAAADARDRFATLLDDVERGETVVITRDGRPVARLAPEQPDDVERTERAKQAVAELRAFRETLPKLTLDELLAGRHEGHKY